MAHSPLPLWRGQRRFGTDGVFTMIEWESDSWGSNVHYAENGSWVSDKHGHDSDTQDR